jgi:hypothetical protein
MSALVCYLNAHFKGNWIARLHLLFGFYSCGYLFFVLVLTKEIDYLAIFNFVVEVMGVIRKDFSVEI